MEPIVQTTQQIRAQIQGDIQRAQHFMTFFAVVGLTSLITLIRTQISWQENPTIPQPSCQNTLTQCMKELSLVNERIKNETTRAKGCSERLTECNKRVDLIKTGSDLNAFHTRSKGLPSPLNAVSKSSCCKEQLLQCRDELQIKNEASAKMTEFFNACCEELQNCALLLKKRLN